MTEPTRSPSTHGTGGDPLTHAVDPTGTGSLDDRPQRGSTSRGLDAQSVGLVAVFTALLVAAAIVPGIPVGAVGVPITLQTLAVMLTGLVLGPVRAAAAVALYLLVGFVGLPVFSRGASGLQVLAGPTAGYLVSFLVAALVLGLAARVIVRRTRTALWVPLMFGATLATTLLVVHPLGVAGLVTNAKLSLSAAIAADLPFLPGDLLKGFVAAAAAAAVHRAFPDVLAHRAARRVSPRA
ncbi:MAG: biotin operon repressor [Humibacillus sp.]|nr:biotin operon repressor [Humibacillus sp.]